VQQWRGVREMNIFRKIRTQGNCWPQKELTAAGRMMIHCAGHRRKGQNKDVVAPRSPKGQTFRNWRWKGQECNNGIRDRGCDSSYKVAKE
jgi:hypothetical protein